jgi:hypothetical protein
MNSLSLMNCSLVGSWKRETRYKSPCRSHISNIKSFLPVEAEISVTKVFITANMKNSKSRGKQDVMKTFVTDISASTGRNDFIFDIWLQI